VRLPASRPIRRARRRASVALAIAAAATMASACGSAHHDATGTGGAVKTTATATAPSDHHAAAPAQPIRLRVVARRRLPAPVQLPGLARLADGTVLAVGGLDAADQSVASVVRLAPGSVRRVGSLPQPTHDIGVAAIGDTAYAFGGGTATGPLAGVLAVPGAGGARPAGHLPAAMSDTAAATIGNTVYVVGGYTTTTPLRSVLAFRPGHAPRDIATLPHPLRYPAVAAVGNRILVAGGTDGVHGRREVLSIDPATHAVRLVGRLPAPLSHAAGAALGGRFYVLGGRGDSLTAQRATIWAVNPTRATIRRAGRLPLPLSDLGATADGDRILVAGGRDARGTVHDELWSLAGQRPGGGSAAATPATRSHVVVIMMENKEGTQVLGSRDAPFLTGLARRAGVATHSYGVTHPSLPNYIALVSGSTQGITDDCTACHANGPNLAGQLERAHRSWGAYLEGLPAPCARPASAGDYAKKHDPFAYDDAIAADPTRCDRRVPLSRLTADVRAGRLPDFALITPNLCHDTHDCPVGTGDRFLAGLVPGLLPALGPHGFLIVTYDEGASNAGCCGGSHGGRIATVVAGPDVRPGARAGRPIDHYGVLASVERAFGLPPLGAARDPRHGSLAELFRGGRIPALTPR
jgi:hypothetical protein